MSRLLSQVPCGLGHTDLLKRLVSTPVSLQGLRVPKPRVRKFGRKTISVTPTAANNTGPGFELEVGWEVGWGGGRPIGVRRCGKRASGSAAAWLAPPAGHPLQHNFSRDIPDATPPRKSCIITSPSPSSRTKTQRMALLRCLRGSSGAGLRPGCLERNYVEEEAFQIFGPGI